MGIPAPTGSALLLSRTFSSPAIAGSSLVSTAHVQQARCYSTSAVLIDQETLKKLVIGQAKCSSVASDCLVEIHTVKNLQVVTLVFIVSGIAGACYVGQQVIERGSEILGQLQKHAPEILGGVCDEVLFQMKIPFIGKGRRLVWKDYWFNNPEKSLSRDERRARRALARQERGQRQREEFNRAEEERRRAAVLLYEDSLTTKRLNDQKLQETLEEQRRRWTGQS